MAFGVLAILCSIGIIWQPGLGALSLVYMIAYTLLIIRNLPGYASFELKSCINGIKNTTKNRVSNK